MHFRLETDASGYVTRAVLSQLCNEMWHPVGFTSKGLSLAEHNYAVYDKEMLSVICGLEEWRHILEGTKHTIEILNNHENLTYFQTAQTLNHHQAHWSLYLSRFDYSLIHRAGWHSAKLDTLSRRANHWVGGEDNEDQVMLPAGRFDWLVAEVLVTRTDPSRVHIEGDRIDFLNCVCDCADRDESVVWALKELGSGANLHGEEWEENNGLVLFRGRVYIPLDGKLRHNIVEAHHDTPVTGL